MAWSYLLLGTGFQLSAKKLLPTLEVRANGTPTKYTAIPFIFLVSHAAELYLKAALLKRGFAERDLKKFELRHDLKGLLGFSGPRCHCLARDDPPDRRPACPAPVHVLRYTVFMEGQRAYMPPLVSTLDMLDELMMLTRIATQGGPVWASSSSAPVGELALGQRLAGIKLPT